jgi:hypothetical protein
MNGISLGGSHGLFTNPGKSLGRMLSLKNVVPDVLAVGGFAVGGPIGAGVGEAVGEKIEGKSWEQSALSGVEVGSLAYGGEELAGAAGAAGAGAGAAAGTGASASAGAGGTLIGNAINEVGADVGLAGAGGGTLLGNAVNYVGDAALGSGAGAASTGTGSLLGNAVNTIGGDVGLGGSGGTLLGNAINAGAADVGIGGATGGASEAFTGGVTSNPGLATSLEGISGNVAAPAGSGISAVGGATGGGGGLLSSLGGARTLLTAGELGANLLRGNQAVAGENELKAAAAQDTAQGQQLESYLSSGTLPPGAQAAINQATEAAKATIRSQYASMGMTGSSAEAEDIANATVAGVTQATNLATQLYSTGMQQYTDGTTLYSNIMTQSLQNDNDLSAAIGNLAVSMIGGSSPTPGADSSTASANA